MPIGKSHPASERQHNFNLRNLGSTLGEDDRDNVCYTMRSYIASRENRDSDSTQSSLAIRLANRHRSMN